LWPDRVAGRRFPRRSRRTGAAIDAAGNGLVVPVVAEAQPYDRAAPTVTITDSATGPATGPVTFTFAFSENVVGFDVGDLTTPGGNAGTLSGFTPVGGSTNLYTVVFNPAIGELGNVQVVIGSGSLADGAGNLTTTDLSSALQAYDRAAATTAVTTTPGGASVANGGTSTDDTPRITITLNSVLASGESLVLSRDGAAVSTLNTVGESTLTFDETIPLAPGLHVYTASVAGAGGTRVLDLNPVSPTDDAYRITI